ncbi:hypothetical protein FRACYDRAFT_237336 [Fragilariopsis cylindrus CCMP1102]|uniref:Zinc finger domain-containing protein n=1 Tax=Fragilariopsis cylindrus CCMP1102 TaxID=635003 RepID=A0A1E7FLP4_9STRA|nr:hypothetical protein FRACYDRAFT_237336 [Fragilariopsis cylindrus CCMP1102]|eukprot:OEU19044.1 hypothetical protein FRACYDRAFT_237336 [Fragilariopsis cylindrus CCMP1102]
MEEEDEFGSFPDGIDFDALDEAVTTQFSSQTPRRSLCAAYNKHSRSNSTSPSPMTMMTRTTSTTQDTTTPSITQVYDDNDEFGSFPDGINFTMLDKAIYQRLNSKPQPRVEVVGSTSNMRNTSTSDIIVINDSDSDSDDEEEDVGKRRGGRRNNIVINDSDSDSDEEKEVVGKRRGGRRNVTSSPTATATSESVGGAKKNQDDIIIIGETLTSEQLLKRKFDSAVTNGNIIVIDADADADAAISNCETFKKRQKVDVDTSPFTQQCQIIISPEKELQQQPQATVQHQKINGRHICRYFGTFQCPECHKRWKTANCWKGIKQACKRCDVFSFPIRKDKLDGRPSSKRMGGSGDGHDSNRCGLCRRLGYKSPCFQP